jgi:hypothetical protein
VEVPPAGFMADKGPGDLMWEVIGLMTPPVTGKLAKRHCNSIVHISHRAND